jgi:mRNA-degrading endonuclease RelE of RelBE toxin-antitoxin system
MNPIPATPRTRSAKLTVPAVDYAFQLSDEIEGQRRRCRASVRTAIRKRLAEIAESAGQSRRRGKAADKKVPPLRFYVYEGYRIAYQLDSSRRRVIILNLEVLPVD